MGAPNRKLRDGRRLPRSTILPPGVLFHSIWKALNSYCYLRYDWAKILYLTMLVTVLRKVERISLFGFCIMDNHAHKAAELLAGPEPYSSWMRDAHSGFAQGYNLRNKRTGPVGNDRPKTIVIRDQEGLKRVMFYQDYNPVAAGLVEHPKDWRWSSYRFYAYGEKNSWTKHLTKPQWYLDLADTDEERQRLYREQAAEYWRKKMLPTEEQADKAFAYGNTEYNRKTSRFMTELARMLAKKTQSRRTVVQTMRREFKALHREVADWTGDAGKLADGDGEGTSGNAGPP
jgi:putative transposase